MIYVAERNKSLLKIGANMRCQETAKLLSNKQVLVNPVQFSHFGKRMRKFALIQERSQRENVESSQEFVPCCCKSHFKSSGRQPCRQKLFTTFYRRQGIRPQEMRNLSRIGKFKCFGCFEKSLFPLFAHSSLVHENSGSVLVYRYTRTDTKDQTIH